MFDPKEGLNNYGKLCDGANGVDRLYQAVLRVRCISV